jgi:hypothetical protein
MSTHDSKNGLSNRGRPRLEVIPRLMERNRSFVLGLHGAACASTSGLFLPQSREHIFKGYIYSPEKIKSSKRGVLPCRCSIGCHQQGLISNRSLVYRRVLALKVIGFKCTRLIRHDQAIYPIYTRWENVSQQRIDLIRIRTKSIHANKPLTWPIHSSTFCLIEIKVL